MLGERPKTAEELNAELYEKVSAEFEEYKNNLLMLPPEQLLEHAYAYAVRSDIVIAIECGSIHARQAQALLKSENALDEIFGKWEDFEKNHMDTIRRAIECKANESSREEFKKKFWKEKRESETKGNYGVYPTRDSCRSTKG